MINEQNPDVTSLVERVRDKLRARNIYLSYQSEELIKLTAQSWFEEPLRLTNNNIEFLNTTADEIVDRALDDPHVTTNRGNVQYFDLFYSLAEAGKAVVSIGNIGLKRP